MKRPSTKPANTTQRPKGNPARSALSPEEALRRRVLDPNVPLKRRVRFGILLAGTNPTVGVPLLLELRKSKRLTHQQADRIDAKIARKSAKLTKPTRGMPMLTEDRARLDRFYADLRTDQALRIHARALWRLGVACEPQEVELLKEFEQGDAGIADIYAMPALP